MKLPSMFCVLPFELFIAVQVETPIYIYSLHMIKIDFLPFILSLMEGPLGCGSLVAGSCICSGYVNRNIVSQ